ncbi:FAS1 domain superfamily [Sesbania bispinosa]|nr:FAS1 domain superfamily [Sesbania bispinosa]
MMEAFHNSKQGSSTLWVTIKRSNFYSSTFYPFVSSSNFDSLTNPVRTLAGDNPGRLELNVTAFGNSVNITTGMVNATLTGVVYSDKQLAIYHVDKVLLPLDLFKPKPPAPAPSLEIAPKADKDDSDHVGTSKDIWRNQFENN